MICGPPLTRHVRVLGFTNLQYWRPALSGAARTEQGWGARAAGGGQRAAEAHKGALAVQEGDNLPDLQTHGSAFHAV